jgi:hypothetical protein
MPAFLAFLLLLALPELQLACKVQFPPCCDSVHVLALHAVAGNL